MINVLAVAAGGAMGASLRYLTGLLALATFGAGFPYGTMIVNVVGSFFMGYITVKFLDLSETVKLFLLTGLLGGFTTFSAFSLDFYKLMQGPQTHLAFVYLVLKILIPLTALYLGVRLAAQ